VRGLCNSEAQQRLREVITTQSSFFKRAAPNSIWRPFHGNKFVPITEMGYATMILFCLAVFLGSPFCDDNNKSAAVSVGCVIIFFIVFHGFFFTREIHLHNCELNSIVNDIVEFIKDSDHWSPDSYPSLVQPELSTFSLTWTYRDGHIVNLPSILLVEGDVIVLGASRAAPTQCRLLSTVQSGDGSRKDSENEPPLTLEQGEVYNPEVSLHSESTISQHDPAPRALFEVITPPILNILEQYITCGSDKQSTILDSRYHNILPLIEQRILLGVLALLLLINILRWLLLRGMDGDAVFINLLLPVYSILPLLPLVYPLLWVLIAFYGSARLTVLFNSSKVWHHPLRESGEVQLQHIDCLKILRRFIAILGGESRFCPRSANLVHTLGSITVLCCADKDGILCYPNPLPEKVFLFKHLSKVRKASRKSSGVPDSLNAARNSFFVNQSAFEEEDDDQEARGLLSEHGNDNTTDDIPINVSQVLSHGNESSTSQSTENNKVKCSDLY